MHAVFFYLAVFLSSFLLFMVQPMVSKALLPAFGGSYLVWGAAMVFFQAVLLAGYLFSHAVQKRLGVLRYARWHGLLLLLPFLFFPFRFEAVSFQDTSLALAPGVFLRLLTLVSGPFLTLSMTSLVLQRWLSVSPLSARANPYVLYSASNAGSVLALLAYPTLIEPFFGLEFQGMLWWAGYALLAVLHLPCLPRRRTAPAATGQAADDAEPDAAVPWRLRGTWFMLSLAPCAMLLAVTNVLTFDVASVPFLWVLPLALYMLAFVLTFKHTVWFPRWMAAGLDWASLTALLLFLLMQLYITVPPVLLVLLHLAVLFVVCVNCSARLIGCKPASAGALTDFYVTLATGGLAGSLLVSWMVPLLSSSLVEYLIALALVYAAVASAAGRDRAPAGGVGEWRRAAVGGVLLAAVLTGLPLLLGGRSCANALFAVVALPSALLMRSAVNRPRMAAVLLLVPVLSGGRLQSASAGFTPVARLRNYYGIYNVYDRDGLRYLQHGTTQHGRQYLAGEKRAVPLAYFHPTTPAAEVMTAWRGRFRDIGMVGLGTGALAVYAGEGQHFTTYELDPDNLDVARRYFSYLDLARENGARLDFVFGDGRVSLRHREPASLDLLMMDAFSSGSVPVHLLTVEAFETYLAVLRDDGLLLLNISNKALDLAPTIYANARAVGAYACEQSNLGRVDPDAEYTVWMAVARRPETIAALKRELLWHGRRDAELAGVRPWTDRYSHVLGAVRWLR